MLKRYVLLFVLACAVLPLFADDLVDATEKGDKDTVAQFLAKNMPIHKDAGYLAAGYGHKEIVEMLLAKNAPMHDDAVSMAAYNGHKEVVEMLVIATPRNKLAVINKGGNDTILMMLNQNLQDYLRWLRKGAKLQNLSKEDAVRFAAIAFTMPACVDEFKALLKLLKPEDFKVFTPEVIKKAMINRNIKAFKLLVPHIEYNKKLIEFIQSELDNPMYQQKFVEELRALVPIKPQFSKMGKGDIGITFG